MRPSLADQGSGVRSCDLLDVLAVRNVDANLRFGVAAEIANRKPDRGASRATGWPSNTNCIVPGATIVVVGFIDDLFWELAFSKRSN
jgi:hypothetical protein